MIARLRRERGLSMLALAKRADVSEGYISMLESGVKKNPSLAVLRRLAKALGVDIAQLAK